MPWLLWGEAFGFAIEVMNISGNNALEGETPYFRRFGQRPDMTLLRTWGCIAFIFTPKVLRKSKLENPGKPGLFVGYAKHSESYRILNLITGNIVEVRSVEFEEDWTVEASYAVKLLSNRYGRGRHVLPPIIPYVRLPRETSGRKRCCHDQRCEVHASCGYPTDEGSESAALATSDAPGRSLVAGQEIPTDAAAAVAPPTSEGVLQWGANAPYHELSERESGIDGVVDLPDSSLEAATRLPPDRQASPSVGDCDYGNFAGNEVDAGDVDHEDGDVSFGDPVDLLGRITSYEGFVDTNSEDDDEVDGWRGEASRAATPFHRSSRVRRPNVRLQDYEVEIPTSLVVQAVNLLLEPQNIQEALQGPDAEKWIEALEKEHSDLMRNNTCVLVERPKGKKILSSKWVFVRKRNHKGEVIRYRARITIKGCQQEYGANFWDTYAPVVSFEAVKLVLLLALHYGLLCEHIDFVTVFLNGPIGDGVEIYMEMPEYFNDGSGRVCRLLRSL
ncbi:hypothetical protein PR002_g14108 [Phytophthora rubi]|uniref:Uncharacterized protein n=1 Tax=Phytophthora rubi TaxID=129364 RepID=A0A6A3L836_9STRA|nr:hypothetical protein PR002_g14108 [Phytophthora rubi]